MPEGRPPEICKPFPMAPRVMVLTQLSTTAAREKGTLSTVILPASILEKSRISLMMASSDWAEVWTRSRYSRSSPPGAD